MTNRARCCGPVLRCSPVSRRGLCFIDRIDPRMRILTAAAFSVVVALVVANDRFPAQAMAVAVAVLGVLLARLRLLGVLRRLAVFNLFVLLLVVLLPLTQEGSALLSLGPLDLSKEGFLLAAAIALKGNAIVLVLMVLLGTMEITILGHALNHLRVPEKLTHLFLFTIRYLDVFQREYLRLAAAMKMRAFRPRISWHTYRSYGYLVGMLLVRSLDRSERIVAAMKCRGFQGRFYLLEHFAFSRHDVPFGVAVFVILSVMILMGRI